MKNINRDRVAEIEHYSKTIVDRDYTIRDRDNTIIDQNNLITTCNNEIEALQANISRLTDRLTRAEGIDQTREINDLKIKVNGKSQMIARQDANVKILTAELDALKLQDAHYKAQDSRMDKLVASYVNVDSTMKILQSGLLCQKPCKECPSLSNQITQLNDQITSKDRAHLKVVESLKNNNQVVVKAASVAEKAHSELQIKYSALLTERNKATASLDQARTEILEGVTRTSKLEADISQLTMELVKRSEKLQAEHMDAQKDLVSKHKAAYEQAMQTAVSKEKAKLDFKDKTIKDLRESHNLEKQYREKTLQGLTAERDAALAKQIELSERLTQWENNPGNKKRKHAGSPETKTVQKWRAHCARVSEFQQYMIPTEVCSVHALTYEIARCFPTASTVNNYEKFLDSDASGWFCLAAINFNGPEYSEELEDNTQQCEQCARFSRPYCVQVSMTESNTVNVMLVSDNQLDL